MDITSDPRNAILVIRTAIALAASGESAMDQSHPTDLSTASWWHKPTRDYRSGSRSDLIKRLDALRARKHLARWI